MFCAGQMPEAELLRTRMTDRLSPTLVAVLQLLTLGSSDAPSLKPSLDPEPPIVSDPGVYILKSEVG